MRPPKYPLEPLAELRDRKVDEAAGALAVATRERDAAERRKIASEGDRQAHVAAADRVRCAEARALAEGGLRAADLAQSAAWEARIATERAAIASDVERAREEESGALAREATALHAVALCKAEAGVVAKDRARWNDALRKRAEARDEEASCEAWRPAKA